MYQCCVRSWLVIQHRSNPTYLLHNRAHSCNPAQPIHGGVLRSMSSRRCAIHYDVGLLFENSFTASEVITVWRQIDRARQMSVMISSCRKGFDQKRFILAIDLLLQFISADCFWPCALLRYELNDSRSRSVNELVLIHKRLMMKTVLSSIRFSSPISRNWSSSLVACSSSTLQISLADWWECSRIIASRCWRSSWSLPS